MMVGDPTGHLVIWEHATIVQGTRVLSDEAWPIAGDVTKQADVYMFLLALRNVRRAAAFIRESAVDELRPALDGAIGAFDSSLPHAKNLRDVLEHFDEYDQGKGRLSSADGFTPVVYYERGAETYELHVALGRRHLSVEVGTAMAAAQTLVGAIADAIHAPPSTSDPSDGSSELGE